MFTEADFEIMVCKTLSQNGWKYIPAEELPRQHSDILVESMVKSALIRLNPVIAEDPSRADEVIYKLRTLILSAQANNIVAANEEFKKLVFENNSFPFGENGRSVSVDFFGTLTPERLALNEYVVNYGEDKYRSVYEKCKQVSEREKKSVQIEVPAVTLVNRDYIKNISTRAVRDVENNEFDSAITKARTLLEEVFCYMIEEKNIEPEQKGDIKKLYKQVKDLYNMHTDSSMDKRINELLSGLEKIIDSIAEMRNKNSDSHGVGQKRINILEHHARLFVNTAITMADFFLSVCKNQ